MKYTRELILDRQLDSEQRTSVVYALINNNDIVYIGKTNHINQRLNSHKNEGSKEFEAYTIIRTFDCDSDSSKPSSFESEMIRLHKPLYNTRVKTGYEEFIDEVKNSNKSTKWKIAELLEKYPDITANSVKDVVGIGIKTVYKHMANLGSPQGKRHSDDLDDMGVDQWDSFMNGNGDF